MNCKDCKYKYKTADGDTFCEITHLLYTKSCNYIDNDSQVVAMNICYNCKHWIGGGDWGLSCRKDYYNTSTNGFREVCEHFERKLIT